jgi:methylthioribose-1-phosphate isomerase
LTARRTVLSLRLQSRSRSTVRPSRSRTGCRRLTQRTIEALRFDGESLLAIDQRELPWRERWLSLRDAGEVAGAISRLSIRGAPLIGVAAAYGVALELRREPSTAALERACQSLRDARPTAVNLARAVERVRRASLAAGVEQMGAAALAEAIRIQREEEAASEAIALAGADLLGRSGAVLTHCNTGALAAPGRGTALAVIAELARREVLKAVIVTETRPLLQGARLTAYELARLEIPFELVVDAAAASVIASGAVDAVIVGCDRVAANGDVANKVGTYGLALAADAAQIPFVVAGPSSTIDFDCPTGGQIVIEERDPAEIRAAGGAPLTTADVPCRNPAFDVTPAALITALVTERGVAEPVSAQSLSLLMAR